MFGFLVADENLLEEEELRRYKACYCGLCRTISERHGTLPRASLSFDMTFLVLLLDSLYDPETDQGKNGCVLHPFSKREWKRSAFTEYAPYIELGKIAYFSHNAPIPYKLGRRTRESGCLPTTVEVSQWI